MPHASSALAESPQDEEAVVTAAEWLEDDAEEVRQAALASAYHESEQCSFAAGPVEQIVFGCRTCFVSGSSATPVGICFACSLACHLDHDTFEIGMHPSFQCDCGTKRCADVVAALDPLSSAGTAANDTADAGRITAAGTTPLLTCTFDRAAAVHPGGSSSCSSKTSFETQNEYVPLQNFYNKFCSCHGSYDPDSDAMIRCCFCREWFHQRCISEAARETWATTEQEQLQQQQERNRDHGEAQAEAIEGGGRCDEEEEDDAVHDPLYLCHSCMEKSESHILYNYLHSVETASALGKRRSGPSVSVPSVKRRCEEVPTSCSASTPASSAVAIMAADVAAIPVTILPPGRATGGGRATMKSQMGNVAPTSETMEGSVAGASVSSSSCCRVPRMANGAMCTPVARDLCLPDSIVAKLCRCDKCTSNACIAAIFSDDRARVASDARLRAIDRANPLISRTSTENIFAGLEAMAAKSLEALPCAAVAAHISEFQCFKSHVLTELKALQSVLPVGGVVTAEMMRAIVQRCQMRERDLCARMS